MVSTIEDEGEKQKEACSPSVNHSTGNSHLVCYWLVARTIAQFSLLEDTVIS
jgi:hypothetical protein